MPTVLAPRLSIRDLALSGQRLFLRADFNVPLDGPRITDDTRIREVLPTIRLALDRGAAVILASHLGRPKDAPDPKYSLAPVRARLQELLALDVGLAPDCTSDATRDACLALGAGQVLLLENLRFHPEEKKGDEGFARRLASYAQLYVNDAFGVSHRPDASVCALAKQFATPAAGLLLEREIAALGRVLGHPDKPFVGVLGGAKVSDKIPVLRSLLPRVDTLLVGGAMAYTFLAAKGENVGASLTEPELAGTCLEILREADRRGVILLLPADHVVAPALDAEAEAREIVSGQFQPADKGVDIGPKTRETYGIVIGRARTVVWNGPLGVFETPRFSEGTRAMAAAIAASSAYSVVGGGDSVAALNESGLAAKVSHVSTGGGAMLEALAGDELPGIVSLAPAGRA